MGGNVTALEAATRALARHVPSLRPAPDPLSAGLEDALLLLCATPLATVRELSFFGRVPASTLRDRLTTLAQRDLVDAVPHRLGLLGPHPQRRYFPTPTGLTAAGAATADPAAFLHAYPVSRQWFRLLAARLDAVAVLYHVATLVAAADPSGQPVRVDHCRQGPYDALVTLPGGRSLGLLRQGPMLPTATLRYRLRSLERLHDDERPTVTLLLTYADQATRRAVRSVGDPRHHRTTFVATEGELVAGGAKAVVWQQGGTGVADDPPAPIAPDAALADIVAWTERLLAGPPASHHPTPTPDPDALYPTDVRATRPDPDRQLATALAVQLTRADKETLDLLAAWPRCTRPQLAGLLGGVTRHRAGQALRSLLHRGLVRADGPRYVLTDDALKYLAHRDRAAVGPDPLPVERPGHHPSPATFQRLRTSLRGDRTTRPRYATGAPGGAHRLRRCPDRRGQSRPGLRVVRPATYRPLRHRLLAPRDPLRGASRRFLRAGLPRPVATLLPGVRAPGHHPAPDTGPAGVLPPVL